MPIKYFISLSEREYRCLGQWKEEGLIYTYTERRDMIGYECFVGLVTAKGDIYLREAGTNCERGQEPLKDGMRLTQVSKCYASRQHPRLRWRPSTTSRPRKKITALPSWREKALSNDIYSSGATLGLSTVLLTFLVVLRTLVWTLLQEWKSMAVNEIVRRPLTETATKKRIILKWKETHSKNCDTKAIQSNNRSLLGLSCEWNVTSAKFPHLSVTYFKYIFLSSLFLWSKCCSSSLYTYSIFVLLSMIENTRS